jgi:serine/threonine-protein kinase
VILYQLLAGRLPFTGAGVSVVGQILDETPPPPSKLNPDIDPPLGAICLKAMARKIEDRYASMGALAAALTDYLRSERGPGPAPHASSPSIVPAPSHQRPAPAKESTRAEPSRRRGFWRRFLPF